MAFSVVIVLNAVDVSDRLTGEVVVSAKEGEARTADFTLNPPAGPVDPYDWIGQAVTISFVDGGSTLIFTGIVHLPEYDIATGLTRFLCTDNLQEQFETIGRPAIDAMIPGYWDGSVFNDPDENWTYAQQRISCYPGAFDLSADGTLRTTDWQAKAVPDFTFNTNGILDNTLELSLAERRNITNSIKIAFASRYERLWQRELSGLWDGLTSVAGDWGQYLVKPYALPSKVMVENAFSDWMIKSLSFTDVPPSGSYGASNWILNDYGRALCTGANAVVAARWKQNVTDNYALTVQSTASIGTHGLLEIERAHATVSPADDNFERFDHYQAPIGALIEPGNYVATNEQDTGNALLTAVWQAKVEILKRHRSNGVQFAVPIRPDIDLIHTVRANHAKLQAKGKVYSFIHTIDTEAGSAITALQLAIYLPNIPAQTDDPIAAPASPYQNPAGLPQNLPALGTFIGNETNIPAQDPNWLGWVTNYDSWVGIPPPSPTLYEPGFTVETPAINEGSAVEFSGNHSFNVAIPQDELVIVR